MGNNKNLIFAVVLVVGFIAFWDHFIMSRYAPPKPAPKPEATTPAKTERSDGALEPTKTRSLSSTNRIENTGAEKEIVLKSQNSEITLGSQGARIKSWKLRERDHWVELVYNNKDVKTFPLETEPNLNFVVQSQANDNVVMAVDSPNGYRITKSFKTDADTGISTVNLDFENITNSPLTVKSQLAWGEGLNKKIISESEKEDKEDKAVRSEMRGVALAQKVKTWRPGFIFGRTIDKLDEDEFKWAGVDNNHFLAAFLPAEEILGPVHVKADKNTAPIVSLPIEAVLAPGQSLTVTQQLFVGPKKLADLKEVGFGLEQSVDFGFFGVIAKLILATLEYLKGLTGNYGWAIVILTILYQILVFPLTRKSLQSSAKMKVIQPQLKKIQQQYKSDPKRIQIETFNLYKKNGMKFMGMEGCLPILVQMPLFIAMFNALRQAYELRGAPWVLWVTDLAAPDPFYVLPVVMGLGMYLQQKLTAVSMDPAQAKMMMFMPILMVVFFINMPAGLVLFWCIQSLFTIFSHRFLFRSVTHPKPSTP